MVKTTKGGKTMNPTDAYRKEIRKKELKRNKEERKKVREVGILKKDPESLREQIQKLEAMKADGALDKARKFKKRQLQDTLNLVIKKRKMSGDRADRGKQPAGEGRRLRRLRYSGTGSMSPFSATLPDRDDPYLASMTPFPTVPSQGAVQMLTSSITSRRPLAPDAPILFQAASGLSQPPHFDTLLPDDNTQLPDGFDKEMLGGSSSSGMSRTHITVKRGGHEFSTQKVCANRIGKIIELKFDGSWISYRKVPSDVRDLWFSEFENQFTWYDGDRTAIRTTFDHVSSNCLRNRLYDAKSTDMRPKWIMPSTWAGLKEEWAKEPYKERCAKNKQNRDSDCGGKGFPKHACGSITQLTHNERLREKLGREPTVVENFMNTHSKMNPEGERVWVDDRSRNLHDAYTERFESQSSGEGSNATPPPMTTQIERWTEFAGSPNMGRVYGLGGMARQHIAGSSGHDHSVRERELESEIQGLRQQMSAQAERMSAQDARMAEMMAQIAFLTSSFMAQQSGQHTSAPPPYPTMPYDSTSQPSPEGTRSVFVPTPFYPPHRAHIDREGTQDGDGERERD